MAIFPGSAISSGGYDIDNSLQFYGNNQNLYRTPSSDGNRQTWTWSGWVKRSEIGSTHVLFGTRPSGSSNQNTLIAFNSSDQIYVFSRNPSDVVEYTLTTTEVFRDPSAWYHIVFFLDTTESVSENRMELYVNGVRMSSFNTYTQPTSKDLQCYLNQNIIHHIGSSYSDSYFDGYMTEVHFVDGQALDATYFGETDSTYGNWIAKEYTGTYGTNGFYLDFEDTFYEDKSGNGNDWTTNNLVSGDVTTDVPTLTGEDAANFATINPLYEGSIATFNDGALRLSGSAGFQEIATIAAPASSNFYYEVEILTRSSWATAGFASYDGDLKVTNMLSDVRLYHYAFHTTRFYEGGTANSTDGFTASAGDIVGIHYNNGTINGYKNGTLQSSSTMTMPTTYPVVPYFAADNASTTYVLNFGQKAFSYTPPTGAKKLNTHLLDDPAVVPGNHFDAVTYTGNSGDQSIRGLGFKPELVWMKSRSLGSGANHVLVDAVRGASNTVTKEMYPNLTNDDSQTNIIDFTENGFDLNTTGSDYTRFNASGQTYVSWAWNAGNAITLNEDGAITSNTSVNTSAGISIATYRGTGSSTTVGHGLGVAPDFIIVKARNTSYGSNAGDWIVWHKDFSATERIYLNYTLAKATGQTTTWNSTLPSSTVVSLGNNIHVNYSSTSDYVMYSFTEVDGFSKFGKYVGNNSTDGPFVYTGFRPRWILMKSSSNASTPWQIFDSAREQFNPFEQSIITHATSAEPYDTASPVDFLSNGFKLRGAGSSWNNYNTGTWIYAAFAEQPFKYANAMGTTFDKFTAPSQSALTVGQSARYDGSASDLSRTPSVASNKKTWTWSGWVKLSEQSTTTLNLMAAKVNGLSYPNTDIAIQNNVIRVWSYTGAAGSPTNTFLINKYTTRVFRDPSAWYHIVVALDTTHATAEERCRIYVNGERVTDFSTNTNPTQDRDLDINGTTQHTLGGSAAGSGGYLNGNLAEVNFVDGQALGPESFGYKDSTYGDWRPRSYDDFGPEVDYGPNGFRLDFQAGALGSDVSGNGNDWTLSSMSSTNDVVLDSPSNNFATLNPLIPNDIENPYDSANSLSITEGGLKVSTTSVAHAFGTIPLTSGKWYWEGTMTAKSETSDNYTIGIYDVSRWGLGWNSAASRNSGYVWYQSGAVYDYGTSITDLVGETYTTGDIIGIALDLDNGKIYFAKNNTWLNSGDPAAGTGEVASGIDTTKQWLPVLGSDNNNITSTWGINFGQDSSFAGAETRQSNQDGNSIGDFYYTPPTGYLALCTSNLDAPSVVPTDYFNTVKYTGDGATGHSITGVGFEPDFVWIKNMDTTYAHQLYDSVRGVTKALFSNLTNAETTNAEYIQSFDSDGFTYGSNVGGNNSGDDIISWNWNAGDSVVVNTDGDISANVSANTASGFSIVSYEGNGTTGATVGHGLSSTPEMIIAKDRSAGTYGWVVWHEGLSDDYYISLNTTSAQDNSVFVWDTSGINSSVMQFGTWLNNTNVNGNNYIAYCFRSVEGFSKFGSYTGNGSTDGTFVYTGFRPAWIMVKRTDSAYGWALYDSKRGRYNYNDEHLRADTNDTEFVGGANYPGFDFLSNGFKARTGTASTILNETNASGGTYIYAAFAEYPFKYANAR